MYREGTSCQNTTIQFLNKEEPTFYYQWQTNIVEEWVQKI